MKRLLTLTGILCASLVTSLPAQACAACFGQSDSPMAHGMNAGIFTLLAVIGTMLALIASFFVFITRKAGRAAAEEPGSSPSQS